jgi:hypothetical protein
MLLTYSSFQPLYPYPRRILMISLYSKRTPSGRAGNEYLVSRVLREFSVCFAVSQSDYQHISSYWYTCSVRKGDITRAFAWSHSTSTYIYTVVPRFTNLIPSAKSGSWSGSGSRNGKKNLHHSVRKAVWFVNRVVRKAGDHCTLNKSQRVYTYTPLRIPKITSYLGMETNLNRIQLVPDLRGTMSFPTN